MMTTLQRLTIPTALLGRPAGRRHRPGPDADTRPATHGGRQLGACLARSREGRGPRAEPQQRQQRGAQGRGQHHGEPPAERDAVADRRALARRGARRDAAREAALRPTGRTPGGAEPIRPRRRARRSDAAPTKKPAALRSVAGSFFFFWRPAPFSRPPGQPSALSPWQARRRGGLHDRHGRGARDEPWPANFAVVWRRRSSAARASARRRRSSWLRRAWRTVRCARPGGPACAPGAGAWCSLANSARSSALRARGTGGRLAGLGEAAPRAFLGAGELELVLQRGQALGTVFLHALHALGRVHALVLRLGCGGGIGGCRGGRGCGRRRRGGGRCLGEGARRGEGGRAQQALARTAASAKRIE